jgi:hypothetical protein
MMSGEIWFLHYHCQLHAISLVRRPLVLSLPGFWSSLVRFAHLCHNLTWKRKLLRAIAHVVAQSHLRVPVEELPADCAKFKIQVEGVFSAIPTRPREKKAVQKYLSCMNGDPSSTSMVHFCKPGCHATDSDSLADMITAVLLLFSSSYDVPLLARWKHYDPAIHYVVKGICLHCILPRALSFMTSGQKSSKGSAVDGFVQQILDSRPGAAASPEDPLADLLECDPMHAEENAKRQKKLLEYWSRPIFLSEVLLMKKILQPFTAHMDELFKRTSAVHELTQLLQFRFGDPGRTILSNHKENMFVSLLRSPFVQFLNLMHMIWL